MVPETLPSQVEQANEVELKKGLCIFSQGQEASNFLVVTQGCITVFARSVAGKEVVLYRVHEGELCVLTTACLIGHTRYPAEAVTDADTRARVIPQATFERFLDESAPFRRFVFAGMGSRLAQVTRRFEHLVLDSVRHRLVDYLVRHARSNPVIEMTHERLAIEIGTAREVVSRNLKSLEDVGFIRLERGSITVTDFTGLESST